MFMSAKVFKWIDPLISMSYFVFVLFCSWFIWSNAMWTFVRRPSSVNFSHLNLFLRNCLAKWTTTYGMSSIKINQFNQSNMDFFSVFKIQYSMNYYFVWLIYERFSTNRSHLGPISNLHGCNRQSLICSLLI